MVKAIDIIYSQNISDLLATALYNRQTICYLFRHDLKSHRNLSLKFIFLLSGGFFSEKVQEVEAVGA